MHLIIFKWKVIIIMIEVVKYLIVNMFLLFLKIVFLIPLLLHHIIFIKKKKTKPFQQSLMTKILCKYPLVYECSILIWNFPILGRIYSPIELHENTYILQVGCGTGLFNKYIKKKANKISIDNLDINEEYLMYGKEKKRFPNYILGSIYNLECEDNTYDVIFFARCFHHLKNPRKVLLECYRVIKDKGKIIIYDPVSDLKQSFHTRYINTEFDGMIYDYHKDTFVEYIRENMPKNFEIEKVEFLKNFTVTNYNYKYPHTDVYMVLRKNNEEKGNDKECNDNLPDGAMYD